MFSFLACGTSSTLSDSPERVRAPLLLASRAIILGTVFDIRVSMIEVVSSKFGLTLSHKSDRD